MKTTANKLHYEIVASTYEAMRPKLLAYLCCRTKDEALAEDILQDTFLQMLVRCETVIEETVEPLAYRMATNLLIDNMRRRQKRQQIDAYLYERTPRSEARADQMAIVNEIDGIEQRVVSAMAPQRQRVYQLVRHEGKTPKEVATIMGLDNRTVSSHLCFGRKEVRKALLVSGW
ncbi:MAG: sigma-70 family RNA polymerase sigma factor [Prevotella sp.]|nr:sigma-70 family RNA polymerase sigma factor [Prevotella sp.]